MCWSGSPASRRAMPSQKRAANAASGTPCSAARLTPCTKAASSSESARGDGIPAAASRAVALAISSESKWVMSLSCGLGELLLHVGVDERLDDVGQVAVEHLVEVVGLVAPAVVGDAVLRVVDGADPPGAVHRTHLPLPPARRAGRA